MRELGATDQLRGHGADNIGDRIYLLLQSCNEADQKEVYKFIDHSDKLVESHQRYALARRHCWTKCITQPITQAQLSQSESQCALKCITSWFGAADIVAAAAEQELSTGRRVHDISLAAARNRSSETAMAKVDRLEGEIARLSPRDQDWLEVRMRSVHEGEHRTEIVFDKTKWAWKDCILKPLTQGTLTREERRCLADHRYYRVNSFHMLAQMTGHTDALMSLMGRDKWEAIEN